MIDPIKTLAILFAYSSLAAQDPPKTIITNGTIDATIYLPDADIGYYQGVRFDWSGVIPKLTFKGHNYFGKWFKGIE